MGTSILRRGRLTSAETAASVRRMSQTSVPRSEVQPTMVPVDATRGYWYWFSFSYYGGSPAVLAEQEVRTR